MNERFLPGLTLTLVAAAIIFVPGQARSQGLTPNSSSSDILFVPTLKGEFIHGLGVDSRAALTPNPLSIPTTMGSLTWGYRHYFDPAGRFGLGAYGGANSSLDFSGTDHFFGFSMGLCFQYRSMNSDFIYAPFGAFVEIGTLSGASGGGDGSSEDLGGGRRLLVALETGFGFLSFLDPYIFAESGVRFGLEFLSLSGTNLTSISFGYQLRLDLAIR